MFLNALVAAALLSAVARAAEREYFWNTVTNEVTWDDPGGVPYVDETTNKRYWYDPETGSTSWENPQSEQNAFFEVYSDEHQQPYYVHRESGSRSGRSRRS